MIRSAVAQAVQVPRAAWSLRRFELLARGLKPRRPICLIYGNCQAEPIRALLAGAPEFAERYEAVRIPPVHLISASQVAKLHRVVRVASLIVAQPIKDAYRGYPLGTGEVLALAPDDCRVIRFPVLYYDALYPFQVNLHIDGRHAVQAPTTMYHDLRTLCAAAKGLRADAALQWMSEYRPPDGALRGIAEKAVATLRERQSTSDITAIDSIITAPGRQAQSFFTVNHPAGFVLERIACSVRAILGSATASDARQSREPLGVFRTPLERPVIDALGLASEPAPDWVIKGKRIPAADVVRLHLRWYQRHPHVVEAGLLEHSQRIEGLRLLMPLSY